MHKSTIWHGATIFHPVVVVEVPYLAISEGNFLQGNGSSFPLYLISTSKEHSIISEAAFSVLAIPAVSLSAFQRQIKYLTFNEWEHSRK